MATIIHIQEITSTQVSEVNAASIEDAMWAYAHNAAFNWDDFDCATLKKYPHSEDINCMEFEFITEKLTIQHIYGNRYTAEWVNI